MYLAEPNGIIHMELYKPYDFNSAHVTPILSFQFVLIEIFRSYIIEITDKIISGSYSRIVSIEGSVMSSGSVKFCPPSSVVI